MASIFNNPFAIVNWDCCSGSGSGSGIRLAANYTSTVVREQ
jgi:hypothetical protein